MLSVGASPSKDIIQRLNYGVVFRPEAKLSIASEAWLHTFQIDIPRSKDLHIAKLSLCSLDTKYSNNCLPKNTMVQFIQHLHDSMLHDLSETILTINILVPQTNIFDSVRNTRSALPFIGTLAKGLFGLATMSDVQLLASHINALNSRSRQITNALQQHGDHLSSFVKVIDDRTSNLMQGIKENSLEMQKITHSFQDSLKSFEQSMANTSQFLITLTNNFNMLRSNLLQLQASIQSLVEGRISPFLIPKHDFAHTLNQIQATLTKYYPGFYLTHPHPAYYYTTPNFMFTRNHSSLYITVRFPVSSHAQPLQLYKIISLPIPVTSNTSLKHATQLLDLPQYLALSYQHDYYLPLYSSDLTNCVHGNVIYCNFNMALVPTSVPQCSLSLFQNDVKQVSRLCNFRFLENHISHDIIELTPTSVLVFDSEELDLDCPQSQRKIPGCTFCVIDLPCRCSLSSKNVYFSPRLVHCYNSSLDFSVLHPVNLALVQEFFDEKAFNSILADSLFATPVPLSVPNFLFYTHNMSKILAADAKTHLNLKKIATAAKQDNLIFKTLAEPLLSGDISLQSTWPDVNAILSLCSLGIASLSIFAFVFLFCKTRKMAMTLAILQQFSNVKSQSVPSFIYVKPTQLSQADSDNTMERVTSFFSSEFSWVHASVILSIIVLLFLFILICYLYKSKQKRCTSLVLEVTCGGNCVVIPILDLSLCPSYYEFSRPSVQDLTVASFPSCKLFAVWTSFNVTNKLTQKCVQIPTTLPLSFLQFFRIQKILNQPFNAYIYVTHQGFASILNPPANAPKHDIQASAAVSSSLYPSLLA